MAPPHTILLIGPRAAGKTTIGRLVADRLGVAFSDLDERVRAGFGGATVAEIWERDGEPAFRDAETRELAASLADPPGVLALGGGTPMIAAARRLIDDARRAGRVHVVLLLADASTLAARIARDPGRRPSLTDAAPDGEAAATLAARLPTYRTLADESHDTGGDEPAVVAARIAAGRTPA